MAVAFLTEHPPIPGYEPARLLGRNGAIVYLARQLTSGELVVLKVYDPRVVGSRLTQEALLGQLDHPNILRVFELGEVDRRFYSAVEYVDRTLAARLRAGPLPAKDAALLARTLALTLEYVRLKGMVHLNLTPPSILLASETVPKLFDVELTDAVKAWDAMRWIVGLRPAFNPPEDLAGERRLPSNGDVYRVGAALYAMLTGQPPFLGDTRTTIAAVFEQTPVAPRQINPNVSRDMEAICLRCLEKNLERRYSSLRSLADDLECLSART